MQTEQSPSEFDDTKPLAREWIRLNIAYFGAMLGMVCVIGAICFSVTGMVRNASATCVFEDLFSPILLFVPLSGASYLLCRWIGKMRKIARWCFLLTVVLTLGSVIVPIVAGPLFARFL